MKHHTTLIPDAQVFLQDRPSLAVVLARAEASLTGTALRDTRSAFRALERAGLDLARPAQPQVVQRALAEMSPGQTGLSAKRLANIRSLVIGAVKQFGDLERFVTRRIPLAPDWEQLQGRLPALRQSGLSRLAAYATVKGIAPGEVTSETLLGLHRALVAEEMSKDPRNLIKATIGAWNLGRRTVPGWPQITLSSPFKTTPFMIPLADFPASFQADLAAWEARMVDPDPLDPAAPARAMRPDTLEGYRFTLRRLAAALVQEGMPLEEITGIDVFFTEERFKTALRAFQPGQGRIQTQGYSEKMARQMLVLGRHHLGMRAAELAPFEALAAKLRARGEVGMGARNRTRLQQFDDAAVVQRLLRFPEEELERALALRSPLRQAKGVERALAISLMIFTGLRVKNLRELQLDQNVRRSGSRVFLQFDESETKTHTRIDKELPEECVALLDLFLARHRSCLPGSEGPTLFPGQTGGPRSYSAMREALSKPLWTHAGIKISPHLYRHVIAKITVEHHPERALDVSRHLGHRSINTTYQSYLGTEGPAASRRINGLLDDVREGRS